MSTGISNDVTYGFINWNSWQVIDLTASDPAPGTAVINYNAHYNIGNNQFWTVIATDDPSRGAFHYIVNKATNTYLDFQTSSDGTRVVVANPKSGKDSQTWSFITLNTSGITNSFLIRNVSTETAITIKGGNSGSLAQLTLETPYFESGGDKQQEAWQRYAAVPVVPNK